jgi:hypothetical protein
MAGEVATPAKWSAASGRIAAAIVTCGGRSPSQLVSTSSISRASMDLVSCGTLVCAQSASVR